MPKRAAPQTPPCWEGKDSASPYVPGVPDVVPRARSLTALFRSMRCCTRCELAEGRTQVVIGTGAAHARVMFIGEGPGAQEDREGRPFIGAAGRLFDSLLQQHGIARAQAFITNVVACRPPSNRTPKPREVRAHAAWLEEQIRLVDPEVLVTLGRAALTYFLPRGKVTELNGRPQPLEWQGRARTLLPLFHPAAALRSPDLRPRLDTGIAVLRELLDA